MSEVIRVATLNTEGGQGGPHRKSIVGFLHRENPTILAAQEVFAPDTSWLGQNWSSPAATFLPNFEVAVPLSPRIPEIGLFGIALISALPPIEQSQHYFTNEAFPGRPYVSEDYYPTSRGVLTVTYAVGNRQLCVATTHFTWSQDGSNTPEQWDDWSRLSKIFTQVNPDVILGDFNVPRGTDLAKTIERTCGSQLHQTIQTTMDHQLHKDPCLPPRVVDYIFIPKNSQVRMVPNSLRVCSGVSDHCAIVCDIVYR